MLWYQCPSCHAYVVKVFADSRVWDFWFYLHPLSNQWAFACSSELAATTEAGILPESDSQPQLFSGPRDLAATAAKYMVSFREAEENTFKMRRVRMVHSGSHVSAIPRPARLFFKNIRHGGAGI